jgi:HEAT repeat protein
MELIPTGFPFPDGCNALGAIGPDASPGVPLLECTLNDPDYHLRLAAARALTRIVGAQATNAIIVLNELKHDPEIARVWMSDGQGGIGFASKLDFSNESSRCVRVLASAALWPLGLEEESPVPTMLEYLHDPFFSDKKYAVLEALGELGPEARIAIPELTQMVDPSRSIVERRAVAIAIRKIDPDAADRLGLPGVLALP